MDNMQDYINFELEYKVINEGKIKLFDYFFVDKNKDKCKIIYNGKEYELSEYFEVDKHYNYNDSIIIQLRINNNITDISEMFWNCEELLSIKDIPNINYYHISNLNKSFSDFNSNNSSEKSQNSNGTEKSDTFCDENSTLSPINNNSISSNYSNINDIKNIDYLLSKKIFCNVTNMSYMFYGCYFLISLPDLSKWDTKNVFDMNEMFYGCSSLVSIPDISKWDTGKVTDMHEMFYGCFSLKSLPDISK